MISNILKHEAMKNDNGAAATRTANLLFGAQPPGPDQHQHAYDRIIDSLVAVDVIATAYELVLEDIATEKAELAARERQRLTDEAARAADRVATRVAIRALRQD